jgi:hypothetical protein
MNLDLQNGMEVDLSTLMPLPGVDNGSLFVANLAPFTSRAQDITREEMAAPSLPLDLDLNDTFGDRDGGGMGMGHFSSSLSSDIEIEVGRNAGLSLSTGNDDFQLGPELTATSGSSVRNAAHGRGDSHDRASVASFEGAAGANLTLEPDFGMDDFGGVQGDTSAVNADITRDSIGTAPAKRVSLFESQAEDEEGRLAADAAAEAAATAAPVAVPTVAASAPKRKRPTFKMDNATELSDKQMKAQIEDARDLVRAFEPAPSSRALKRARYADIVADELDSSALADRFAPLIPLPPHLQEAWSAALRAAATTPVDAPESAAARFAAAALSRPSLSSVEAARKGTEVELPPTLDDDFGAGPAFEDATVGPLTEANLEALNQTTGSFALGGGPSFDAGSEPDADLGVSAAAAAVEDGSGPGLSERASRVAELYKTHFKHRGAKAEIDFKELSRAAVAGTENKKAEKKKVVSLFFESLVLASKGFVNLAQGNGGKITVSMGRALPVA